MAAGGRIIPDNIQELSMCEIFVFGSNLAGQHQGGAARIAYDKFGAEWGVGVGRTGQTYAIPTMHGGVKDINPYVDDFIEYARNHSDNRFLVTRIGCGIAGFKDEEIAPLFQEAWKLPNVKFPRQWLPILTHDEFVDAVMFGVIPKEEVVEIPKVITERYLMQLCDDYRYIIGSGVVAPLPKIEVRYIIDNDRFGYAQFGDFYLCEFGMYVWSRNKEFAEDHNQDMVEAFFHDECRGRGYFHRVIFAGVKTPYKDTNRDDIYTGDVIHITSQEYGTHTFALGTLGEHSDKCPATYAFLLDNHCMTIDMCDTLTRVGTVFYQIDRNETHYPINDLCYRFQPAYPDRIKPEDKLLMAKYTPNFYKEIWKYHGFEILGVEEYNWRK